MEKNLRASADPKLFHESEIEKCNDQDAKCGIENLRCLLLAVGVVALFIISFVFK